MADEEWRGAADREAHMRMDQRRRQTRVKLWIGGLIVAVIVLATLFGGK